MDPDCLAEESTLDSSPMEMWAWMGDLASSAFMLSIMMCIYPMIPYVEFIPVFLDLTYTELDLIILILLFQSIYTFSTLSSLF